MVLTLGTHRCHPHASRTQATTLIRRLLVAVVGLVAAADLVAAQTPGRIVSGRVIDAESGTVIEGAVVESPAAVPRRVATDALGEFRLRVATDTVRLLVWRIGYAPLDTLVAPAPGARVELRLDRRPIQLRGLTVDAEREGGGQEERALFESELTPGVIGVSRRDMAELPGLAEVDVLRSLQALPGVVALNDLSAQLHVWGGAPDQSQFLLDGARIFGPYHMFGMFGAFNADAVERVEFFRNVLPARRGGVLSASVEAVQRDGHAEGTKVDAGLGLLGARVTARGSLPWADGRWVAAGRRTHLDVLTSIFGVDFPYAFHDLHGRLELRPAAQHHVSLSAFASADRFRMFLHSVDDNLRSRWRNAAAAARWEWGDRGVRAVSTEAWGSVYRGALTIGTSNLSPTSRNRVKAGGLRIESVLRGTRAGARVGLDIEGGRTVVDGAERQGGFILGDEVAKYMLVAGYTETELRLGPVRLAPGARAVYARQRRGFLLEPRLSARLNFMEDLALTVGAGRSHQLLSTLRDDRYPLPGAPFWFVHRPEWPLSRADGLGAELEGWLGDAWQLRISGYIRTFDDVPRWRPTGRRDIGQMVFDDGTAEGLELSIRRHNGILTGWLSYGLARVQLEEAETGNRYFAAWDRRHAVDMALFMRPSRGLTLSARVVYGSGMPFWPPAGVNAGQRFDPLQGSIELGDEYPIWANVQERYPDYFRVDIGARLQRRIRNIEMTPYLSVLNLTMRENVLYYTLAPVPGPSEDWSRDRRPLLQPELQLPLRLFPSIGVEVRF